MASWPSRRDGSARHSSRLCWPRPRRPGCSGEHERGLVSEICVWNRQAHREETEQVYGAELVNWLYGTRAGQAVSRLGLTRSWPSRAYGWLQSSRLSRAKISPFIRKFGIRMEEYETGPFRSFNEFFVRKFQPGAR